VPWPVRRGGWVLKVYENSLGLAFVTLFLSSMALHALSGAKLYSEEQMAMGEEAVDFVEYLGSARFWFESFQNWQSEFLAIGSMVVLSIFSGSGALRSQSRLRQRCGKRRMRSDFFGLGPLVRV
jgi:hypothetical protein